MLPVDVPQTSTMYRHIDRGDYSAAYACACLGVTHGDWTLLAVSALQVSDSPNCTYLNFTVNQF
jgi:hypothetical protein